MSNRRVERGCASAASLLATCRSTSRRCCWNSSWCFRSAWPVRSSASRSRSRFRLLDCHLRKWIFLVSRAAAERSLWLPDCSGVIQLPDQQSGSRWPIASTINSNSPSFIIEKRRKWFTIDYRTDYETNCEFVWDFKSPLSPMWTYRCSWISNWMRAMRFYNCYWPQTIRNRIFSKLSILFYRGIAICTHDFIRNSAFKQCYVNRTFAFCIWKVRQVHRQIHPMFDKYRWVTSQYYSNHARTHAHTHTHRGRFQHAERKNSQDEYRMIDISLLVDLPSLRRNSQDRSQPMF